MKKKYIVKKYYKRETIDKTINQVSVCALEGSLNLLWVKYIHRFRFMLRYWSLITTLVSFRAGIN